MKTAVVTTCIGSKFEAMAEVTHPSIKAYAERIGAEFIVIDENKTDFVPHFAKLQLLEMFSNHERIIFLDTDVIVRDDCPNLFDVVPEHKVGLFREGMFIPRRKQDLEMAAKTYSVQVRMNPDDWKGHYWNTGVLVASRQHKWLFESPDFEKVCKVEDAWDYGEQGWLNLQIINSDTPVHDLDYRFNRMTVMDEFTGMHRRDSYIVHYAGAPDMINLSTGPVSLFQFMQKDLEAWQEEKEGGYKYHRRLLVFVGGGMGDQVDAEPVVRHLKDTAYPEAMLRVISDWPRIFAHLVDDRLLCSCRPEMTLEEDQPYFKMETLPIPESIFGFHVSHALNHSTDYSSLSCLHTTLPAGLKQIKLTTKLEDVGELIEVIGKNLRDIVLVHPGHGWPSKTFPSEYWQDIIEGILAKGLTPCLIGLTKEDDKRLVDVECPDGCLDLRNKTSVGAMFAIISSARVLVTNDSAPLHIAGAFDNYMVVIPTCKHQDHILPWRKGNQYYKSAAMCKSLLCDQIESLPTTVMGQTIDWLPGGDIRPFLPEASDVVDKIEEFFLQSMEDDS